MPRPLISKAAPPLTGTARVPGDKSISHRSLMFGGIAKGETIVRGLLEGEDVLRTAEAMRTMGASVTKRDDGTWSIIGYGVGALTEPASVLDLGNAGTGSRLLMGLVSTHPFVSIFTGDASLCARPMKRVVDPLSKTGAKFFGRAGQKLPMAVVGTDKPIAISYDVPVASAQVKSAVLLAGLNTEGTTVVTEKAATRDHTELMLRAFGADLSVEVLPGGGRKIALTGKPTLRGQNVLVPADPSSAAFPLAAALLVPDSAVTLSGVGLNPLRTGLIDTLLEMGADIQLTNRRVEAGEPVADLVVKHGPLKGVDVPPGRAPSMIDEYPILSVVAACATGTTRMRGLGELRVKESDRLAAMATGLAACGATVAIEGDDLIVTGTGKPPKGGAHIAVHLDHRIGMSFLVLGMVTKDAVAVDDGSTIDTSFPGFADLMNGLGAKIGPLVP
ncbi:MAG TPA: 3-phosphoshikimate 1-carboxyvinyltransferase [Magnetospirillaceae bacterium]|jgi:3-phosphoshikimate 1-carboxyvinyltransferase